MAYKSYAAQEYRLSQSSGNSQSPYCSLTWDRRIGMSPENLLESVYMTTMQSNAQLCTHSASGKRTFHNRKHSATV